MQVDSDSDYKEDQFEGGSDSEKKKDDSKRDDLSEDSDESYYREYERLKQFRANTTQP